MRSKAARPSTGAASRTWGERPIEQPSLTPDVTQAAPELTWRAVLAGCGLGALLAAANVYTSLKTAFVDGGNITASVLSFALFALFRGKLRPYSPLENNLTQTIAASAAYMSIVAGISGPIPALALLGQPCPPWALGVWGVGLGILGMVIGVLLRPQLIVSEALPFPTGAATAEVIEAMAAHESAAARRARALVGSALIAAGLCFLRDARGLLPQEILLPGSILGVSLSSLSLGVSVSPLLFATGLLVGLRAGISMLLGSALAWALLAPALVRAGLVANANRESLIAWLMWPGAALVIASSLTSLSFQWRSLVRGARDVPALLRVRDRGARRTGAQGALAALVFLGAAVVVALSATVFSLPASTALLALALSLVLATVCARAAGETDIAPVGDMGGLTQVVFSGSTHATSLTSGGIVAGTASQTSAMLWAFKAGERLGANPRHQTLGQLLGIFVGALVVVPTYAVVTRAYGLGSARLPAPSALSWKATAEAVQGGLSTLPSHTLWAAAAGMCTGCALTLLARTRIGRVLPSPVAIGLGFLMPPPLSATLFLGALALAFVSARYPKIGDELVSSVAGGGIAGESLLAVALAMLIASGLLSG